MLAVDVHSMAVPPQAISIVATCYIFMLQTAAVVCVHLCLTGYELVVAEYFVFSYMLELLFIIGI